MVSAWSSGSRISSIITATSKRASWPCRRRLAARWVIALIRLPRAEHGRWTSYAEKFFLEKDHLVQVAGISVGQIKRLKVAGIATMAGLAAAAGKLVHKLDTGTLEKLVSQARLQCETRDDRKAKPDAKPRYEVLPHKGLNGEPRGLAVLPPANPADVFFDMEGYPLVPGGLEYLFGTWSQKEGQRFLRIPRLVGTRSRPGKGRA